MVPTRSDTNQDVQSQKQARNLKFHIKEKERDCTICVAKTKALISCAVFFALRFIYQYMGYLSFSGLWELLILCPSLRKLQYLIQINNRF